MGNQRVIDNGNKSNIPVIVYTYGPVLWKEQLHFFGTLPQTLFKELFPKKFLKNRQKRLIGFCFLPVISGKNSIKRRLSLNSSLVPKFLGFGKGCGTEPRKEPRAGQSPAKKNVQAREEFRKK